MKGSQCPQSREGLNSGRQAEQLVRPHRAVVVMVISPCPIFTSPLLLPGQQGASGTGGGCLGVPAHTHEGQGSE
eukprot:1161803-Pelagomonas_calceolata.AAC.8